MVLNVLFCTVSSVVTPAYRPWSPYGMCILQAVYVLKVVNKL